ncbi:formyltetrahydrofolate deformylase [Mucilaginibacter sp. RS28]|uniref:Formyltetrahydrofolate deformylase n=1 Tax=Mucilaginibacter straminoryzae TaxID=2932774 RepID=A0A9X1X2G3_9SPHI|nr:formyltetrahydrofolate deformylase [Mucilaginibacter straminoryzae]MCJ8209406.1 formyltetrahydrofolate deformylase [Mucilaginibacter straminoryzae]
MIIIIQCKDQVGLVAGITNVMARFALNIVSLGEHVDKSNNRFFIRLNVEPTADANALKQELQHVLPDDAEIAINPLPEKKIVVLVTKEYHCLADILIRNYFSTLGAQVQAVIGNYDVLADVCRRFDVPFYHISHEGKEKPVFEEEIKQAIDNYQPDYLVLAKFMRILSPDFVASYPLQIINIHHSFLPAFIGANPYRQAYERGVKLIGATAHFVTNQLDEGPIITQQIIPINHALNVTDLTKAGKEIETAVLARALQLVFDDRVLVFQNKTVVFD